MDRTTLDPVKFFIGNAAGSHTVRGTRSDARGRRCSLVHLSDDGFFTGVAASLLRGLYSLAAHVCPQRAEHVLQRGGLGARVAAVLLLPRSLFAVHVRAAFACCSTDLEL